MRDGLEPSPDSQMTEPKRHALCSVPVKRVNQPVVPKDVRRSNRISSYLIPPCLVVLAIFSTYVWFDMCIQWYLRNGHKRTGICLIVFQVILMILAGSTFFRITLTRAGYLPNRADRERLVAADGEQGINRSIPGPDSTYVDEYPKTYDRKLTKKEVLGFLKARRLSAAEFYIARPDTMTDPRYCNVCDVDKYDRVHHCSEVNRCVRKFDHFCPWVGGPLGHTRYKFFFQFITYVAIYCIFTSITLGVALSQRKKAKQRMGNEQHITANPGLWYACIAIAAFFALMMVPFASFHGRQIALNKSTIESVETRPIQVIVQTRVFDASGVSSTIRQRVTLAAGDNPFDLGWWRNWQQVMGIIVLDRWIVFRILNWFVPVCGR